jgi:hypothetical protein
MIGNKMGINEMGINEKENNNGNKVEKWKTKNLYSPD